ncbi:MAG TPA: exodeoxyribonuclease VII large subunit [Candidatus Syntrophosphaera sp.]|jgi:exodeoxyribonuclease VII large subunit|nr:exodeoxyribonuclease VII large subunit [Candidatus Syntrophosphaera sp.]
MDELIVFSVWEISQHLRQVIETQIEPLYVRGEISNYTRHSSGHIYFNLKDDNATLRCTFFRNANIHLDFKPEEGMEVICFGKLTVYEKGGTYNLNVQSMSLSGKGDLARCFELLKKKLQEEGLFDPAHKKKLPRYPRRIGIVTSPTGAALQDILNILERRYPIAVDVFPALVQGAEAPAQLIAGLRCFNAAADVDLIIIGRGGGSQEDLFCFNDEALAREIFASRIPVISAVGHEIDFTIADFVADLRAPTPSAAAELAVPDRKELFSYINSLGQGLFSGLGNRLDREKKNLSELQLRLSRHHPEKVWQNLQLRLDMSAIELLKSSSRLQAALHRSALQQTIALNSIRNSLSAALTQKKHYCEAFRPLLENSVAQGFLARRNRLEKLQLQLEGFSPYAILNQGYSMLMKAGKVVSSVAQLAEHDELQARMKDGSADLQVQKLLPTPPEHAQN